MVECARGFGPVLDGLLEGDCGYCTLHLERA